jgi:hypothetical protein
MPANDWNIRIVSTGSGTAFEPRVPGGTPGGQLLAQAGDVVSWGNATNETHQPWPLDANGNPVPAATPEAATPGYMSAPIPRNSSSTPQYVIDSGLAAGTVINYYCKQHPTAVSERGSIKIF